MYSPLRSLILSLVATFMLSEDLQTPIAVNTDLRLAILRCVEQDQAARVAVINWLREHQPGSDMNSANFPPKEKAEFESLAQKIGEIDAVNTKWLAATLDEHGWPTKSLVGKEAAHAAWLLVQHADQDAKFQRRCLDLMTKLPKGEIAPQDVAYLTDRVLLAEGKKQLYGTQFALVDGKFRPRPIEDETNIDIRRAEVGLPPWTEYVKLLEHQYSREAD